MTILEATPTELTDRQRAWIDSARELVEFLEQHPELIPTYSGIDVLNFATDAEEFAALGRRLGSANKSGGDKYASLERHFGPHQLRIAANREQVCERVQIGERVVEREVLPPGVELVTETVTEPVYEWRCEPWLAGAGS